MKTLKIILMVIGVAVLAYGLYTMITPEVSVDLGVVDVQAQDNKDSYITMGIGLIVLLIGAFMKGK